MSTEPEVQPSLAPLQFDRAVHADPSAAQALLCSRCTKPIADAYYHDGDKTLCTGCGKVRQHMAAADRSAGTFLRATMFGVGGAVVGALLYYGVMEFLGLEIGIVAIAIGWLVGRAMAKATRGRSARRHQIMAVGLTYFSVALAYAPFAIKEWKKEAKSASVVPDSTVTKELVAAPASSDPTPLASTTTPEAATTKQSTDAPTSGGFALALLMVSGILLALPIMAALGSMPGGLLSILIIGFGLRQAWTITVASNTDVTGPHAIGGEAAA
jgi:hypothetical protein